MKKQQKNTMRRNRTSRDIAYPAEFFKEYATVFSEFEWNVLLYIMVAIPCYFVELPFVWAFLKLREMIHKNNKRMRND